MRDGVRRVIRSIAEQTNLLALNAAIEAARAGESLADITESINQISQRNMVIASAAEEQAQVVREVDRNIVNIRDLSLQSATGAHQISTSSHELSRLAAELSEVVTRFRV